ncbi:hypothetical protein [Streptomyces sp. RTd22]|uniref:hypothetical protein n=1 Tax=Streptomyces sp. RTd22 TaxID=1841249 RepID=UPI0007C455A6|nr:hypothetical protein [Streptomyces sp. RTd22]
MISPSRNWWVIYQEPNPVEMTILAVEPAPEGDAAHDKKRAQLQEAGQRAYVITAPDADTASDIAFRAWAEELVASPKRLAVADAHIAANNSTY